MDKLSEIGDGRLVKMEVDFSGQVDKAIPDAEAQAKDGNLQAAVDALMALEKQTRLAADMRSNQKVLIAIVKICHAQKDWAKLNDNIVALTKKRGLIKHAVSKMIQECCTYVDGTPDKETKLKLIDTLCTVTDGKIYVEVERARLTRKLATMKEADGDKEGAAKALLDLQVETFGSLERSEKVDLLLEQMRLCLELSKLVRAQIISKKIGLKYFEDTSAEVQDLKLRYYGLMIQMDKADNKYLNVCRHYLAVYKTPKIEASKDDRQDALKNAAAYVLLAPHDNEQWDLLNRLKGDRNLEEEALKKYKELLTLFTVQELMSWKNVVESDYKDTLVKGTHVSPPTGVFKLGTTEGDARYKDLQIRVVEHNIRMIAKYYTRISLERMSNLLDWPIEKTEEFLCDLVGNATIADARIDRLDGIVRFTPRKEPVDVLDAWSTKTKSLMDILNKVSHLILKEEMVHQHLARPAAGDKPGTSATSAAPPAVKAAS